MECNCDNKTMPPSLGTVLKLAVTAELGNDMHLKDVDFRCTFYSTGITSRRLKVAKEEMLEIDDDTYLAVVDTAQVGTGQYWVRLEADVPDSDVPGTGLRTEVVTFPTYINVIR